MFTDKTARTSSVGKLVDLHVFSLLLCFYYNISTNDFLFIHRGTGSRRKFSLNNSKYFKSLCNVSSVIRGYGSYGSGNMLRVLLYKNAILIDIVLRCN